MSGRNFQVSQKPWQPRHVSDVAEVQLYVREAASAERSVKRGLSRAASALGLSYSRAWSFYYGKARQVLAHEMDVVRERFAKLRARRIGELQAEIRRLEGVDAELSAGLDKPGEEGVGAGPARRRAHTPVDMDGAQP